MLSPIKQVLADHLMVAAGEEDKALAGLHILRKRLEIAEKEI